MRREATARGAWYALGAGAVACCLDGTALGAMLSTAVACAVVGFAPAVGRACAARTPRERVARALRRRFVVGWRRARLIVRTVRALSAAMDARDTASAVAGWHRYARLARTLDAATRWRVVEIFFDARRSTVPSVALPDGMARALEAPAAVPGGEALGRMAVGAPPDAGPPTAPPRTPEDQTADDANAEGGSVSRRCGVPIRACNNDGEADDHGAARDGGDGSTPLGGV